MPFTYFFSIKKLIISNYRFALREPEFRSLITKNTPNSSAQGRTTAKGVRFLSLSGDDDPFASLSSVFFRAKAYDSELEFSGLLAETLVAPIKKTNTNNTIGFLRSIAFLVVNINKIL